MQDSRLGARVVARSNRVIQTIGNHTFTPVVVSGFSVFKPFFDCKLIAKNVL